MLASQQHTVLQPVPTWLTHVQTSLLSETDHAASMLEHAHMLLKTQSDVHAVAHEGRPVIELRVGSRLNRGIKRKDRPDEDSLFTTQGILCSDGLWEMVRDAQIAGILTHVPSDPLTMANMLVQAALVGGEADNVSVIVVRVRKAPGEAEE